MDVYIIFHEYNNKYVYIIYLTNTMILCHIYVMDTKRTQGKLEHGI